MQLVRTPVDSAAISVAGFFYTCFPVRVSLSFNRARDNACMTLYQIGTLKNSPIMETKPYESPSLSCLNHGRYFNLTDTKRRSSPTQPQLGHILPLDADPVAAAENIMVVMDIAL